MSMWMMYQKAKTYNQKPSDALGIRQTWCAWMFDNAVFALGYIVEQRLSEYNKKGRRKWTLAQALGLEDRASNDLRALAMMFGDSAYVEH